MAEPVLQQLPKLLGLTQLALTDCDSFEVSPAQLGAVLGQLSGLQELRLCSFKTAKKYLDSNEIEPLAAAVAGLPRLRSLALVEMPLYMPDLQQLQPCLQQLTSLDLLDCGLSDLLVNELVFGLAGKQQRSSSSREACGRSEAACTKLQRLGLSDNRHVTDAALPVLAQLLPGLTYLDLMSTRVTDGGMPFLQALTQLQELMLDGTRVCLQEKQRALRLPVQRESWEERIDNPIVA